MLKHDDSEILSYLKSCYPEEGCGLLLNKRGKLIWKPCKNVAENKLEDFRIDASDYISASLEGDIYAVVHSHPDASCEPSDSDKKISNFLGIPYIIYSLPTVEKYIYTPEKVQNPLIGREYNFGVNDCYSLVRDYYLQELDITLPTILFEEHFYEKGINYFDELYDNFGFVEVSSPKKHDIIIFNIQSVIPNHCGIYLGEDIFLHHIYHRLSCREPLGSRWNKYIKRYVRCKKFI